MKLARSRVGRLLLAGVLMICAVSVMRSGNAQGLVGRIPMINDWSHRHVVFSRPASIAQAWKLQAEPRYWLQALRRNPAMFGRSAEGARGEREEFGREENRSRDLIERQMVWQREGFARDWGESLGVGGSTGVPFAMPNWWPAYPAKYTFNVNGTPDCYHDFVIFPTNLAGAATQASVIAYDELYSGTGGSCGANPAVYWSYNTGTGKVNGSPVFSVDGSKVAFVETSATGAILHLLKWHAGDGTAINVAVSPTVATNWTADGAAGHCPVAPGACMINIALSGAPAPTVTGSSPFYDYARDTAYVGDDNGVLHKFMNVFGVTGAVPSEVTAPWPITVDNVAAGIILSPPILDSTSGNIFVTDTQGTLSYVRETFSAAGTCKAGVVPCLGSTIINPASHHIPDAPLVDSTTGKVFIFMGNNGTGAVVIQSDITLATSISATLGTGTGHHLHSGAFDNTYLTGNGSAGRLYMCGSSASSAPTIYRIGFTNSGRVPASPFANPVGTMNAAVDAVTLPVASASAECAPVTELFNPSASVLLQDQIFFGVNTAGTPANCVAAGSGCVMSINVTGTPGSLAIQNSIPEIGGPSGIVVDNTSGLGQASSLYFSNQGNSTAGVPCGGAAGVGCAVKVTQATLN
jgi:hypothetical protein